MRVLLSSTGGFGHVLAMLPFARAVLAAGHGMRWATNGPAVPRLLREGIDVVLAGPGSDRLEALRRELADELRAVPIPQRAAVALPSLFGGRVAPAMVDDLARAAEAWLPELLVHEQAELAAPLVGARLGVRTITHAFGGAVPEAVLDAASDAVAPMWREAGLAVPPLAGCFTGGYIDICPPSLAGVPTAHIPRRSPMRPNDVGPGSPDEGPPLILLTLGTVHNAVQPLSVALAGLTALTQPVRVVASVGPGGEPMLGRQPPQVRLERWVEQEGLIPRCRLVVSHAGSGTMLDAMAAGVPMLCLPQGADQFRNAAAVVGAGAGLSIAPGDASPSLVRAAAERLLDDDRFADAARALSREIAAMPPADSVVRALLGSAPPDERGLP